MVIYVTIIMDFIFDNLQKNNTTVLLTYTSIIILLLKKKVDLIFNLK
jgi:hypothetical protein